MSKSKTPRLFVFPPLETLQLPTDLYGEGAKRWKILARSVIANVKRRSSGRATAVLRSDPQPKLAIVGWFSEAEAGHIRRAVPEFTSALSRLRYVDYAQAESDCVRLGEQLRMHLSSKALKNASFVGIPRGGTVVLGLLSYVLDLDHPQVNPQDSTAGPLVVVDDCFLSGARLARFLEDHPSPSKIIAAGLYAHPDLRTAVEREQPRVHSCLTARDLTDHAPSIYGDDYDAWKTRWENREVGPRYWIGIPDHLCFPWSEPDYGFWNAEEEKIDRAWTVAPPDQCLKTRFRDQVNSDDLVQVQRPIPGDITLAPEVFSATFSDRVLVGRSESDQCLELEGTAANFWTALLTHETVSEAQESLQQKFDIEPERLASDLYAFVETLIDRHILKV